MAAKKQIERKKETKIRKQVRQQQGLGATSKRQEQFRKRVTGKFPRTPKTREDTMGEFLTANKRSKTSSPFDFLTGSRQLLSKLLQAPNILSNRK